MVWQISWFMSLYTGLFNLSVSWHILYKASLSERRCQHNKESIYLRVWELLSFIKPAQVHLKESNCHHINVAIENILWGKEQTLHTEAEGLLSTFNELVHGQDGIIRLHYCIRDLTDSIKVVIMRLDRVVTLFASWPRLRKEEIVEGWYRNQKKIFIYQWGREYREAHSDPVRVFLF